MVQTSTPSAEGQTSKDLAAVQKALGPSSETREPVFDIARINPEGTSVFAGHAAPSGNVTVFVDGTPIGSARTDENGEWVLTTERGITSQDPSLSLQFSAGAADITKSNARSPAAKAETSGEDRNSPAGPKPATTEVTARLMNNLRQLVERARARNAKPEAVSEAPASARGGTASHVGEPSQPPTTPTPSPDAHEQVKANDARPEEVAAASQVQHVSGEKNSEPEREAIIPVPIKFVFNEAVLTDEGRQAAQLLIEYVMLEKFTSLKLTGHADERGTHAYNLALSAERLETISSMLHAAGYAGKLDLIPMGEKAPFTGVDRSEFSREALYELDRRVELRDAIP